jgi:hypothetical protein
MFTSDTLGCIRVLEMIQDGLFDGREHIVPMSRSRAATPSNERTVESDAVRTRRSVLGTIGAMTVAAVAGCTAEADRQPTPTPVVDATARVEPEQYETFEFELDSPRWTTVSANLSDRSVDIKNDGPAVDVVVMTAEQYTRFQRQQTFEYVGEVSMPDVVNGEVSATLQPGAYVALVDNSAAGSAAPGASRVTAVVDLEITTTIGQH